MTPRQSRPVAPTLEEHLLTALERMLLLGDIFELQAIAEGHDQGLSGAGCRSLADLCRRAGGDLRALLDGLPVEITNWSPKQLGRARGRRGRTTRRA